MRTTLSCLLVLVGLSAFAAEPSLERIAHNDPGLVVDLGVGLWAWPLPCDHDGDGDPDLVVACPDKPYNGVYVFENPGGDKKMPVFRPGRRIGPATANLQVSYVDGKPRFFEQSREFVNFLEEGTSSRQVKLNLSEAVDAAWKKPREKQWRLFDYDGDGDQDVIIGLAPWDEYGWDDAYDKNGTWTNGPLHGFVYLARNTGTDAAPAYDKLVKIEAGGKPVDVYGRPSPNLADFDGDGDLDLLCGEFLDGFSYFANEGSRTEPKYAAGRKLAGSDGKPLKMDLEMIVPVAFDWDGDGDFDLICGDEDGRVAFIEHTGSQKDGAPVFLQPVYFQQQAADVKCGALATPVPADWDGDGEQDIICGDSAGYVSFIRNLGGSPRHWARPERLKAGGKTLRIEAGENGSIQGPAEAKWGYTSPCVADWDHDGKLDLLLNSIWGKIVWCRNVGTREAPELAAPAPVVVDWKDPANAPKPEWNWWNPKDGELAIQWRTTPLVVDLDRDGLNDLVAIDHEGYLAWYRRTRSDSGPLRLQPPVRCFSMEGACEFDSNHKVVEGKKDDLLRLNARRAGPSGRRKIWLTDWDGDGDLDLLVNGPNATLLEQVRKEGSQLWFVDRGPLSNRVLAGHSTSPTAVDWDRNGVPDLLVGAEDGFLYYQANSRLPKIADAAARNRTTQAPVDSALPPGILSREFLYETAPFPECHAGTLAETKQGLVAAWFGGQKEGTKDVGIWVSRQVDGRWTAPVEVANGIQHQTLRHPCWNPVLHQFANGPLVLFYKCGPSPSTWWGMRTESTDGGTTWSRPVRLPETIDGPVKNKAIELKDGTLVCGSSTEYDGWTVHIERSRDRGWTWERIGPIHSKEEFNAIQPTILQHRDGKLQILCRTKEEIVSTATSSDGGRTWSKMTATSLPNPNSGIDGVTLKDGRFLLVYNHTKRSSGTPRGRALLNIAVSDDGENWQAGAVLENEKGEFSYPACIETSDGLVHVLYTWKRQKLRHVIVDPKKLELKPIRDGVWPGLDAETK